MSNSFQVDVVATPQLDLCGAAARDLMYREANGGKYPAASRSHMAKEQEKLNKFLRYVNESFIIKGFSKANVQQRSPVRGYASASTAPMLIRSQPQTLGDFTLSHGDNAQIQLSVTLTGKAAAASGAPARVTVRVKENGTQVAAFAQEAAGLTTLAAPFLFANRARGVTRVTVTAEAEGEIAVEPRGAFASALVMD